MDEIFSEREELNLYLINRKQEMEAAIETLSHEQRKLHQELGKNRDMHLANKLELQERIQVGNQNVHEFKKLMNIGSN